MKNKTYRFAVVTAVLLMLCLVFVAPVAADANVAKIGDIGYPTLQEAVDAAAASGGAVITLIAPVTLSENVTIKNDNIWIEGQGHTISADTDFAPAEDGDKRLIRIESADNVTLKDIVFENNYAAKGLIIRYKESAESILLQNIVVNASYGSGITLNQANVTASNVTVKNSAMMQSIEIHGSDSANIWLTDGTYSKLEDLLKIGDITRTATVYVNGEKKSHNLNITNGVTIMTPLGDIITLDSEFIVPRVAWIAEDSTVTYVQTILGQWLAGVKETFATALQGAGISPASVDLNTVAAIKKDGVVSVYPTLEDAVNDADANTPVTVLQNVDLGATSLVISGKSVTLDLNGFTISSSSDAVVVSGATTSLTVYDNSTAKTGKITSTSDRCYAIWVYGGSTVTLKDGTLNSTYYSSNTFAIQVGAHGTPSPGTFVMDGGKLEAPYTGLCIINGTATINGGLISGGDYGISGTGGENNGVTDGTTVIITGGKIEATKPTVDETGRVATAIYHPQDGTLTISGGEITGPNGIQFVGDGTLTISGGTIRGTYASTVQYPILNTNGAIVNGAALSIVKSTDSNGNSNYGTEDLVASITGGTFISTTNDAIRIYGNNTGGQGVEGITLLDPIKFIKGGIFSTAPAEKYLVDNYEAVKQNDDQYKVQEKKQVTTTTTTTTTTSKPKDEPPVEEPETPTEPVAGEVTVETEVTNGGEVSFETPAVEGSEPVADAPVEISAVVLPEGTTGEVAFVPVSEQPAPAGKETQTKKVFEINVPTYEKGKAAVVKFTMTVAELAADGKTAAEVALWHFDEETGEWTKLVTSYTIVDGVVYFEAITYDFSPFAIIYEDAAVEEPEQPTEEPETPASPAPVLGVLAALGAAAVLRRK